jgi:hypothetical protein
MLRDDKLYDNNRGPNEIDVACLKARDFDAPQPLRVAASQKPAVGTGGLTIGMESVINENHDFKMVSRLVQSEGFSTRIEQAIIQTKTLGLKDLAEMTGSTIWQVRQTLDKLGYTRKQGRGGSGWVKRDLSTIRVGDKEGGKDAFIDLDARAAA